MLKRSQNAGAAVWSAVSRIFSGAGSTVDSGNQALPEKKFEAGSASFRPLFLFYARPGSGKYFLPYDSAIGPSSIKHLESILYI
ncbi:hypothetical protein [Brucella pinnipedialis]|uniref:hypothetical protein n=1 Tax=Brucella pinnipedialis TaxID=120576 RepID=UPI001AEBC30E|nr:hypothetical protein [Brucella pinnipedialis]